MPQSHHTDDYGHLLADLKAAIRQARLRATLAANTELLHLYWQLGHAILERQKTAQWGDKVTAQLAADLQREFPEMKGLSHRNIKYMKPFAATYPDFLIGQRPVAQLPWAHHVIYWTRQSRQRTGRFISLRRWNMAGHAMC
ncbi:DUF1016 N-terminal domain-containing protein [Fibrella sp. WM1]|uniref:DUF1016 N-terminal domain-containing protein n=1 Tax=Fibrella musci TaxID=3242485 RepID=UPI003522AAF0